MLLTTVTKRSIVHVGGVLDTSLKLVTIKSLKMNNYKIMSTIFRRRGSIFPGEILFGGMLPGGNFPGSNFLGGFFPGGFFPGGIFPDTI